MCPVSQKFSSVIWFFGGEKHTIDLLKNTSLNDIKSGNNAINFILNKRQSKIKYYGRFTSSVKTGCENIGSGRRKIRYIHRKGWFNVI